MKRGGNWRKSDTNVSLWEPRLHCPGRWYEDSGARFPGLRCPALKADGMRTAELGFLD